jgi:hypothetical protein
VRRWPATCTLNLPPSPSLCLILCHSITPPQNPTEFRTSVDEGQKALTARIVDARILLKKIEVRSEGCWFELGAVAVADGDAQAYARARRCSYLALLALTDSRVLLQRMKVSQICSEPTWSHHHHHHRPPPSIPVTWSHHHHPKP